jgi:hypothetical protein
MIYRVLFSLLIAKAAGFASHPDHMHDDGHMMDDHHDHDHPGHTHDELHTHVELHDCSTAEAFTNVYGCLMQQQMAGCWECPHNNPNGNPAATTDCDSELCHRDCPQCRTWSAVPCSPGFPGPMMSGYTEHQPYSATDPTMVDFCMTEQALTCRRGCHTCGTACVTDTTGGNVPGSCPDFCDDPTMCSNGQPNLSGDCAADYPDDDFCSGACLAYVGCINCPAPEETVRDCGVETEFSGIVTTWMTQIAMGCWDCGNCGCASPGCPEGAVSDDAEAPCSAETLAGCQAGSVEGGACTTDPGNCRAFEDVPCAGAWGIQEVLPMLSSGDTPVVPPEFATTEKVCESPLAAFCQDPANMCHGCKDCGVNATGNFECPEGICGSHCQGCVPIIGCLNCEAPQDAAFLRPYVVPPQFRAQYEEMPGLGFCRAAGGDKPGGIVGQPDPPSSCADWAGYCHPSLLAADGSLTDSTGHYPAAEMALIYAHCPASCGVIDPFPTGGAAGCSDTDIHAGARDKDGYDCRTYTQSPNYCGGDYDDDDFRSGEMCCACGGGEPVGKSSTTETHCVDTNDMEVAKAACMAKCDEIGCGCVSVSANDPGTSANPDAECPKARCALAMDPATYTVGSWGQINYDGKGYRSFNNNAN